MNFNLTIKYCITVMNVKIEGCLGWRLSWYYLFTNYLNKYYYKLFCTYSLVFLTKSVIFIKLKECGNRYQRSFCLQSHYITSLLLAVAILDNLLALTFWHRLHDFGRLGMGHTQRQKRQEVGAWLLMMELIVEWRG